MYRLFSLAFGMALAAGVTTSQADPDSISRSGDIFGSVDWCGQGGIADIEVYIPGRSFSARTDDAGGFRLSYVPVGEYTLVFSRGGERVGARAGVRVDAKRETRLGVLGVCNDGGLCPTVYDPVCGSNGRTYGNACEAEHAGIPIAYPGECQ